MLTERVVIMLPKTTLAVIKKANLRKRRITMENTRLLDNLLDLGLRERERVGKNLFIDEIIRVVDKMAEKHSKVEDYKKELILKLTEMKLDREANFYSYSRGINGL